MNFTYNLPVNLLFGRGKIAEIGTLAAQYGRKALIVTGTSSTRKSGLLDRTVEYVKSAGVESVIYDKVVQNPLTTTAEDGALFARQHNCDVIIGLGGGSIMDCAKAIAFLAKNDGDINDYIFGRRTGSEALPLLLVPTTCGTGSEGNGFAVLTNPETGDKKSLRTNAIVAKASIIDSDLMRTMPKSLLATVGFDALTHCMEAYISKIANPISDALSLQGMEYIGRCLVPLCEGSEDPELWDQMTAASTLGGMVIHMAGVTLTHGMEHPVSGLKDVVHGKGLAALTPVVMAASIEGCPAKMAEISKRLGGTDENDLVAFIQSLLEKIGLTTSLSKLGVRPDDIEWMTENCFKVSAAGIANHPVTFDHEGIWKIYTEAM